jgi:hypothetical protein
MEIPSPIHRKNKKKNKKVILELFYSLLASVNIFMIKRYSFCLQDFNTQVN